MGWGKKVASIVHSILNELFLSHRETVTKGRVGLEVSVGRESVFIDKWVGLYI